MTFLPDCMETVSKSEAGRTFPVLRLDNGEPLMNGDDAVTITIKGPDSKAFNDADRAVSVKRMKTNAAGGEFDDEQAQCEVLAAITIGWTGMHDGKGGSAPCTPENAAKLYKEFPAVRQQVNGWVHSRRHFIKDSSPA